MFKNQPIDPSSLLTQLVAGVNKRLKSQQGLGENKTWTLHVKETLKLIGETPPLNFDCIYTDREKGIQEFLLDLVWWDRAAGEGAALAVECEWFYGKFPSEEAYAQRVVEDFEKLLVFKSPLKLMIFASVSGYPTMRTSVLTKIKQYLRQYKHHLAGEVYLFLDFSEWPTTCAWIARIDQPGLNIELDLTPLEI